MSSSRSLIVGLLALVTLFAEQCYAADTETTAHQSSSLKKVLAFYHPWFEKPKGGVDNPHWKLDSNGRIINTAETPVLGAYDSRDPKVIEQHLKWANQAGIDSFVCAWSQPHSFEDSVLTPLLNAAQRQGVSISVDIAFLHDRTVDGAISDLAYLTRTYGSHPAWLKIKNRPVIFIHRPAIDELNEGWNRVLDKLSTLPNKGPVLVADGFTDFSWMRFPGITDSGILPNSPKDDKHLAAFAENRYWQLVIYGRSSHKFPVVQVYPGFDSRDYRDNKLYRDGGKRYQELFTEAIKSQAPWILINSFNEWQAGSEIEPSVQTGDKYIKLTRTFADEFKNK